jgi:hypothetical protein
MIFEYPILLQKFRIFTLVSFFKTLCFFSPRFLIPLRVAPPSLEEKVYSDCAFDTRITWFLVNLHISIFRCKL